MVNPYAVAVNSTNGRVYVANIGGTNGNPSSTVPGMVTVLTDTLLPAPVVDAGANQTLTADLLGRAAVTLTATIANPPAAAASYVWSDGQGHQATAASASFTLGVARTSSR